METFKQKKTGNSTKKNRPIARKWACGKTSKSNKK
jgi:hypothetical protein